MSYQDLAAFGDSPASQAMGFPADPTFSTIPPGFESTTASVSPPPQISTIQKIWDTIKQDSQSALAWTEDEAKSAYQGTKNVVGTVVEDVTSPVTSSLKSVYWYAIVGVIVLAGAIYFIGKGGAIKVNAIV